MPVMIRKKVPIITKSIVARTICLVFRVRGLLIRVFNFKNIYFMMQNRENTQNLLKSSSLKLIVPFKCMYSRCIAFCQKAPPLALYLLGFI